MAMLCWVLGACLHPALAAGGPWDRIGPWNIFDDKDIKGESGTLACAASPAGHPDVIYAGGQNNGVSSGIIKTVDGGRHWTRNSKGLWDTRVLGVWVHPDDHEGNHVFVGTHIGIYESTDAAASWTIRKETAQWGSVMSFREGVIEGQPYILANCDHGILTMPKGGGSWQKIQAPGPIAPNAHLSVAIHDGLTEVVTCIGGWGGGDLYYASLTSATNATWTGPVKTLAGEKINCANAAVNPKDRNHFLYSKGGQYRAWESKDGGKTVREFTNHDTGVYFVMIDTRGWFYTATQAGAFVSQDAGATWNAYHVVMHSRSGRVIDRVPHDYQRIVPDFRGDGIAFPSDQGLHIVNGTSFNLTSAVGDMQNTMALSALISPGAKPGDRNLVVNLWDWDVAASWDDGRTWAGWAPKEKSPGSCGEGGGGQGMGASGKVIMFHRNNWWSSLDGGHNFKQGSLPGPPGAFDYVRQPGSRTEPAGTCFALMTAQPSSDGVREVNGDGTNYTPEVDDDDPEDMDEMNPDAVRYKYTPGLLPREVGTKTFLMTSEDFGQNWTWKAMPGNLQAGGLAVDPTNAKRLFALMPNCLAQSSDKGVTWSPCSTATGLSGKFSQLLIKNSQVMFLLRSGAVPLRTADGGKSWQELAACAALFKYGATMDGSLSWSGNTLVLHGVDLSAISRGEYGTAVWKSTNDGDDWTDETGDLVTISPGPGVWYEKDFYLVTRGEGLTVKRNFEADTDVIAV